MIKQDSLREGGRCASIEKLVRKRVEEWWLEEWRSGVVRK